MQTTRSGQLVRVLNVQRHPQWPNHVNVTVGAETFCCAVLPGYSSIKKFVLGLGERATATVAHDVFRGAKPGDVLDGHLFCYHKAW